MDQLMDEDFEGYPELADALVFDRNARWAEQVAEMLEGDGRRPGRGRRQPPGRRPRPAGAARKRGFKVARN